MKTEFLLKQTGRRGWRAALSWRNFFPPRLPLPSLGRFAVERRLTGRRGRHQRPILWRPFARRLARCPFRRTSWQRI